MGNSRVPGRILRALGMLKVPVAAGATLCLAVAFAVVAEPAQSQDPVRMKGVRVEAGYSANHEGHDTGFSGGLHFVVSRRGNDALRLETGLIAGYPYVGADVGVELRLPRGTPLGILLRAGGGLLVEDGFIGPYVRGGGGVEWTLSRRIALRGTGQAGYHGGQAGPHRVQLGVDYRW